MPPTHPASWSSTARAEACGGTSYSLGSSSSATTPPSKAASMEVRPPHSFAHPTHPPTHPTPPHRKLSSAPVRPPPPHLRQLRPTRHLAPHALWPLPLPPPRHAYAPGLVRAHDGGSFPFLPPTHPPTLPSTSIPSAPARIHPPTHPPSYPQNKLQTFGIIFLANTLAASLTATGAFEVTYGGELVFSKLAAGRMPSADEILQRMNELMIE